MIGRSVRRVEDFHLLTGRGKFSCDRNLPGQAHAALARSPEAHAVLRSVGTERASGRPGVLAVLTADDYAAGIDGIAVEPCETNILFFDVGGTGRTAAEIAEAAGREGLRIGAMGRTRMRAVTHLRVDRAGCGEAADILRRICGT